MTPAPNSEARKTRESGRETILVEIPVDLARHFVLDTCNQLDVASTAAQIVAGLVAAALDARISPEVTR